MPVTNTKKKQEMPFGLIHRTYHFADKQFLSVRDKPSGCSICYSIRRSRYCNACGQHQW